MFVSERLNVLYERNWTRLVTEQLKRFERAVIDAGKTGEASTASTQQWTFGGALLYTLTLLTTIGKEGFVHMKLFLRVINRDEILHRG